MARKKTVAHGMAMRATILIVIALKEENKYFHELISDHVKSDKAAGRDPKWIEVPPSVHERYKCIYKADTGHVRIVVHTLEAMGNIEATLGTTAGIATVQPDLVILVGLAGSLRPDEVQLGDVVVSTQAKLYTSDKVADSRAILKDGKAKYRFDTDTEDTGRYVVDSRDKFMDQSFFRYERRFVESAGTRMIVADGESALSASMAAMERVAETSVPQSYRQEFKARSVPKLHCGWLLANSQVVDSAEFRDYLVAKDGDRDFDLHRQTGEIDRIAWKEGRILAVDMESYGVLRAVETLRSKQPSEGGVKNLLGGIVVRGISDLCEVKGNTDDGGQTRLIAVRNASKVALGIIESIDYGELSRR
ncbi:hypothetical protein [Asticcacaulis sp. YBE204]|uniref:5'-methylthioadenosine/S-adenosylhomocysteine nucleosidase family protein n=1 Tax=Asticcacaulis sp. YBE204 TaxID=1282363 RepID=UPI0003C3E639|nr:hypothetical protein [Asticcacaulis sp. YBE204]ESQ76961.1 hypothetical protein AEYBE204_18980 [Asticcacaulis sp. YBE204]